MMRLLFHNLVSAFRALPRLVRWGIAVLLILVSLWGAVSRYESRKQTQRNLQALLPLIAWDKFDKGDEEEAIRMMEALLEIVDKDARGMLLVSLAQVEQERGNFAEAVSLFDQAEADLKEMVFAGKRPVMFASGMEPGRVREELRIIELQRQAAEEKRKMTYIDALLRLSDNPTPRKVLRILSIHHQSGRIGAQTSDEISGFVIDQYGEFLSRLGITLTDNEYGVVLEAHGEEGELRLEMNIDGSGRFARGEKVETW